MSALSKIQSFTLFSAQGSAVSQEDYVLGKKERGLFAVADGFGGSSPGAAASKTACESVLGFLEKEAGDVEATLPFVLRSYFSLAGNVLFNALIYANTKVMQLNKGRNINERGGASIIAGFLDEGLLALANIGSCSAWLMRDGVATELVTPRSYARLCDPFSIDPNPESAAPLMAMGITDDLEPEIFECRIRAGDWVLLQSDGVNEELRAEILAQSQSLGALDGSELEEKLKRYSFPENASIALLRF